MGIFGERRVVEKAVAFIHANAEFDCESRKRREFI
jgi:hypothetical protein